MLEVVAQEKCPFLNSNWQDWLTRITELYADAATIIMEESVEDNALVSPRDPNDSLLGASENEIPQAEKMSSVFYGSISPPSAALPTDASQKRSSLGVIADLNSRSSCSTTPLDGDDKRHPLMSLESTVCNFPE